MTKQDCEKSKLRKQTDPKMSKREGHTLHQRRYTNGK